MTYGEQIERAIKRMNVMKKHRRKDGTLLFGPDAITDFDICIKELEKAREMDHAIKIKELNFAEKPIHINVRGCPRCGSELSNHGKGWVCTDPECRQRIKQ